MGLNTRYVGPQKHLMFGSNKSYHIDGRYKFPEGDSLGNGEPDQMFDQFYTYEESFGEVPAPVLLTGPDHE